jgi:FkbM family methyltransferase
VTALRQRLQIALTNAFLSVPPFRSRRYKRWYLSRKRRRGRARRRALEQQGIDTLSRPALHAVEDRLLAEIGPGGFFVEAGANDGFEQSNTYWLERFHGWRGVLVEPVPEVYAEAVIERPEAHVVNCALVPSGFAEPTVTIRAAGLMSIVAGARGSQAQDDEWVAAGTTLKWGTPYDVTVPARTLTSVLEEAGAPRPDLLSLDVEGYEPEVLRGLDLERFGPRYLLVEAHDDASQTAVEDVLGDGYARMGRMTPTDLLYRRIEAKSSRSGLRPGPSRSPAHSPAAWATASTTSIGNARAVTRR